MDSREELLEKLVRDCQDDLATYIVPDSGISDFQVVNTLLSRLDGPQSRAALTAAPPPAVAQEPTEADIDRMAYILCELETDEPHTLIWEGQPPEPWGEVWQRHIPNATLVLQRYLAAPAAVARQEKHSDDPTCGNPATLPLSRK